VVTKKATTTKERQLMNPAKKIPGNGFIQDPHILVGSLNCAVVH
jgi:hypothetical protein